METKKGYKLTFLKQKQTCRHRKHDKIHVIQGERGKNKLVSGINRYILLYAKQINNKVLLHSTPGEGNGSPLQYSCLVNLMVRRAWWVTIHGVARVGYALMTKPPLYNTRNCIQYLVITYNGKECEKNLYYTYTHTHCCTAETNTTL